MRVDKSSPRDDSVDNVIVLYVVDSSFDQQSLELLKIGVM